MTADVASFPRIAFLEPAAIALRHMRAKGSWIYLLVPLTLAAGGMSWFLWRNGDEGKWTFLAFTGLFFVVTMGLFLPPKRPNGKPAAVPETRFVGARILPFYLLLFGGLLVTALLVSLFRL